MGMADIATAVVHQRPWRFDPQARTGRTGATARVNRTGRPTSVNGQICRLSDTTMAEIEAFPAARSCIAGHPERGHASGIEVTTGPLGQGLGTWFCMALAERLLPPNSGESAEHHHTYVFG